MSGLPQILCVKPEHEKKIGTGISLLSANWIVALSYMLPVVCMYLVRVPNEEKTMIEQFGDKYRKYVKRTGRLIPKLIILIDKNRT